MRVVLAALTMVAVGCGGEEAGPVGPLVLSAGDAAETRLVSIPAAEASSLCGRRWDWIEVAG